MHSKNERLASRFNEELLTLINKYKKLKLHDCFIHEVMFSYRLTFHVVHYEEAKKRIELKNESSQ